MCVWGGGGGYGYGCVCVCMRVVKVKESVVCVVEVFSRLFEVSCGLLCFPSPSSPRMWPGTCYMTVSLAPSVTTRS